VNRQKTCKASGAEKVSDTNSVDSSPLIRQNNYFYLATYYSSQAMAQVGVEKLEQIFPQNASNLLKEQTADAAWTQS